MRFIKRKRWDVIELLIYKNMWTRYDSGRENNKKCLGTFYYFIHDNVCMQKIIKVLLFSLREMPEN